MREFLYHEFPDCDTYDQFKFKLDSSVHYAILNLIYGGQINVLSVIDLISNFEDTSVDNASKSSHEDH